MLTPYVTIDSIPEFSKCKSGFGYMVYDIARSVSKLEQVDLLVSNSRGDAFVLDDVHFHERSFLLFIRYFCMVFSVMAVFKLWNCYKVSGRSLSKLLYYWFISGYYYHIISTGNYDIVHIHGCGLDTELWMRVCKKAGVKYIVTLHGLNSFSDTVSLEPAGKQYERDFLKRVTEGEFHISVISTGMKRLIERTYGVNDCPWIFVVCNSFSFIDVQSSSDSQKVGGVREKHNLALDDKILLYVGNVCRRKNQGQLIRAFNLLPKRIREKTFVLFLGGEPESDYRIKELTKGISFDSHFISCGPVAKDTVSLYYKQGDAVALMSLSEGFGLSLIEGMHFGLPCIAFSDIDAFEDIYDENVMIGVSAHDDESVAKGLEQLLGKEWNKPDIIKYSIKFESPQMARNYVNTYNTILQEAK